MQAEKDGQERLPGWAEEPVFIDVAIAAGAIVLLTILGPFGTGQALSPFPRLVYWAIAIGAGYAGNWFHERVTKPRLVRRIGHAGSGLVNILIITIAAMSAVVVLEFLMRDPIPMRALVPAFASVLVVAIAVWGVSMLGARAKPQGDAPCPRLAAFREKLPAGLRSAQIMALSAEDHYIRVFTDQGEALITGRFADALTSVASITGSRIHRSWWVADAAVSRLERNGGRWQLLLADGGKAPVSRSYRADVRAFGWDRRGHGHGISR